MNDEMMNTRHTRTHPHFCGNDVT